MCWSFMAYLQEQSYRIWLYGLFSCVHSFKSSPQIKVDMTKGSSMKIIYEKKVNSYLKKYKSVPYENNIITRNTKSVFFWFDVQISVVYIMQLNKVSIEWVCRFVCSCDVLLILINYNILICLYGDFPTFYLLKSVSLEYLIDFRTNLTCATIM